MIAMVVAMAEHNVIGQENGLPWYLPADLKHFKALTTGHTVVMGRTTFESIVARLHKPLPDRRNVVISRDRAYGYEGVEVVNDVSVALTLADDVFIIGGAQIYAATIEQADRLYVTEVHAVVPGDTYFPAIDPLLWQEVSREPHKADEKNKYDYDFVVYDRR